MAHSKATDQLQGGVNEDEMVECEQKCGQSVLLKSLAYHMRDQCDRRHMQCVLCDKVMEAKDEVAHDDKCPKMVISCKWCHTFVPRESVESHVSMECQDYPTFCRFALHGCTVKIVRRELASHHDQDMHKHMELLNAALEEVEDSVGGGQCSRTPRGPTSYELPTTLWPKIQTAFGNKRHDGKKLSVTDRITQLEETNRVEIKETDKSQGNTITVKSQIDDNNLQSTEILKKDISILREEMSVLETKQNDYVGKSELQKEIKVLKGEIELATAQNKLQKVDTSDLKKEIEGMKGEIVWLVGKKLEKKKKIKNLKKAMEDMKGEIDLLTKQYANIQMNSNAVFSKDIIWSMTEGDSIVGERCYKLPVYWRVKNDTRNTSTKSPHFYLSSGYRMVLASTQTVDTSFRSLDWPKYNVRAYLQPGLNDEQLPWPWDGKLKLVVRVEKGLGTTNGTMCKVGCRGRSRPTMEEHLHLIQAFLSTDVDTIIVELHEIV